MAKTQARVQLFNGSEAIGALQSTSERETDRIFVAFDYVDDVAAYFNETTGCPEIRIGRHILRLEGAETPALAALRDDLDRMLDDVGDISRDEELLDVDPFANDEIEFDDVDDYDYVADDRAFDAARERSLR